MCRFLFRALFGCVAAAMLAHADPPANYSIALVQVTYGDAPAPYTILQLFRAAQEITDYYSRISYGNLNLKIDLYTFSTGFSKNVYFYVDAKGRTWGDTGIVSDMVTFGGLRDLGTHDGIVVVSNFTGGPDYTAGTYVAPGPDPRFDVAIAQIAFLFVNPPKPGLSPPGPSGIFWGSWAHEIGHMIQFKSGVDTSGAWNGHPSGYLSGYALMDSAYPSSPSAYSVLGTALMTGSKRVFNGWLPDSQVITIPLPASGSTSTPVSLIALSESTSTFAALPRVVKLPVTAGVYYLVEARQRTGIDILPTTLWSGGVWDEGIHIVRVDESGDPPVQVMNACDWTLLGGCVESRADPRLPNCPQPQGFSLITLPRYCWPFPLFEPGDSFGAESTIGINVVGRTSDGYNLIVNRGPHVPIPDTRVLPRPELSLPPGFNVSGLPTRQVWIDSSCNGYATDVGPVGLRFGDPAESQSLAVGDDLCMGHENRLYARIENRGTAPAMGVRVHFDLGDPWADRGPCALENCPFLEVGVADAQRFPALASLPPGAQATVWVPYTPVGSALFATPALRVRIDPVPGEISTGDNIAFSDFGRIQIVSGLPSGDTVEAPDLLYTDRSEPATVALNALTNSPRDLTILTLQTPARFNLVPGQQLRVPIRLTASRQLRPAAGQYAANVTLSTFVPLINPVYSEDHGDFKVIAAQTVGIDVVEPSAIELQATAGGDLANVVQVSGRLQPNRKGEIIALDYIAPNQAAATLLAPTGGDGRFQARLLTAPQSSVRAIWAGNETYAPAATGPIAPARN